MRRNKAELHAISRYYSRLNYKSWYDLKDNKDTNLEIWNYIEKHYKYPEVKKRKYRELNKLLENK